MVRASVPSYSGAPIHTPIRIEEWLDGTEVVPKHFRHLLFDWMRYVHGVALFIFDQFLKKTIRQCTAAPNTYLTLLPPLCLLEVYHLATRRSQLTPASFEEGEHSPPIPPECRSHRLAQCTAADADPATAPSR